MKKINRLIATLLFIVLIASALTLQGCITSNEKVMSGFYKASEHIDGYATVYASDVEDFKILLLSDPQVDSTEKYKNVGSTGNEKTYQFVREMTMATSPDLVIINGDLVMHDAFTSSTKYFKRYADIFEELKVPWSFTFGNHDLDGKYTVWDDIEAEDEDGQCSKQTLIDYLDKNYKYCLINSDPECDGEGNHIINIRKKNGELIYSLFLFDCEYNQRLLTYNKIPTAEQIEWYKNTIDVLSDDEYGTNRTSDEVIKSMIFNHVGVPEFYTAWQLAWNNGEPTEDYFYGHLLEGDQREYNDGVDEDEQLFAVAKQLNSTTAIFMAHHHDNDMSVNYEGIRLTFGQHSGYSHYYRTLQEFAGSIIVNKTNLKSWRNISFELLDDYGDQRGGTGITITNSGKFEIKPLYARDVLSNFKEEYYIDYDAIALALDESTLYPGTVARGEYRKWRIE